MHRPGREAQGLEARTQENLVAPGVMLALFQLFVMWTVNLDDQPSAQAKKVWIVAQQGRLSSKVEARRL
jgi:hypothetical protein